MKLMPEFEHVRKFEIPYNFDPKYLTALDACGLKNENVEFMYIYPFVEDYQGVNRLDLYGACKLDRAGYADHMHRIAEHFPGKMQLLLQNKTMLMSEEKIRWYMSLGFTAFCCANPQQARMIKDIDSNLITIESIVTHVSLEKLRDSRTADLYDYHVLDFSFCKDLQKIRRLPQDRKYMLLTNALCNTHCPGDHHWFVKNEFEFIKCPGKLPETGNFGSSTLIRPMDLHFFDPYIAVYKMGDRSWDTEDIIRDLVLYTTDYSYYPGIEYDSAIYESDTPRG